MGTYREFFPKAFFAAADLDAGPITLTITGIAPEKMPDGAIKPCISFREDKRKLVLAATNAHALEMITGSPDPADAAGTKVTLVQEDTVYQGRACKGVRIHRAASASVRSKPVAAAKPAAAKAATSPKPAPSGNTDTDPMDDEIPFR